MAPRLTTTTSSESVSKTVATSTPAAEVSAPDASLVNVVRKKDLIERVSEASGVRKGMTKKVVDVMLKEMGDMLQDGTEMILPPLGKLSVNRQKEIENAFILILKLRRAKGMLAGKPPVVDGEEVTDEDANENETS